MPENLLLIYCSCPDISSAQRIADALVAEGLAACVQITPAVTAVYTWQGQTEHAEERVLMIKTRSALYNTLQERVLELHPYELPEVIAVPVVQGLPGYIDWVEQCTKNA